MLEIILNLFLVGAVTGFIYSMPIAGPISVIMISKALQGKVRFCLRTALGAALVESIFVFIVVYGIAALIQMYRPVLPYFLFAGAIFVVILGLKITQQKIDLESIESDAINTDKYENRGGLRTGIVINLTNPTLLVNWFIASFVTLSFVSSIGLNIGGLDLILNEKLEQVSEITGSDLEQLDNHRQESADIRQDTVPQRVTPLVMSLTFALGVGTGAYLWLYVLTKVIIKYRDKIKSSLLDMIIHGLGIVLILIGFYIGYRAFLIFFA